MTKKIKNQYILFSAFLIIFMFLGASFVYAMEVNLGLGESPDLPKYVSFIFSWAIGIAGTLSLISFVIGAIGLINPNVEAHGDAKDRMKGAVLGLVLTMVSVLIIDTINPEIKNFVLDELEPMPGVFLMKGNELKQARETCDDTSKLDGFTTLKYTCSKDDSPALLVWKYGNKDFKDFETSQVTRVECGGTSSLGSSYKLAFEKPGVHYCLGGCTGNTCTGMSEAYSSSHDNVGTNFAGKIKNVVIVNSPENNQYYGVIFHKVPGLENGGICSDPILEKGCSPVKMTATATATAADIFQINRKTPETSGDGVTFFSEPFGEKRDSTAGFYPVPNNDKRIQEINAISTKEMKFVYEGVNQNNEYIKKNKTFKDKPGSMDIKGDYLVALYSNNFWCQTFSGINEGINENADDLGAQPVTAPGSGAGALTTVYIIPTQ